MNIVPPESASDDAGASGDERQRPLNNAPVQLRSKSLGWFTKLLAVWVFLCIVLGTVVGAAIPAIPNALQKATISQVWIPGVVLVWLMVYPMMLGVEWNALKDLTKHPMGLLLTTVINWAVQPFLMYALALLFFTVVYASILPNEIQKQYLVGAVILGGSPCTAMVFVWSSMSNGNPTYTLIQVMLNDLILLVLYIPTLALLLSIAGLSLPWDTVAISVALFVVVPAVMGIITRVIMQQKWGPAAISTVAAMFAPISTAALLVLVTCIFTLQAHVIIHSWVHVLLIAIPLLVQIFFVFALTYTTAYLLYIEHSVAGPAAFIGSSNFFELAVSLAITLYGPQSGATLVTVVGVLVEVPIMLLEVEIVNRTKQAFTHRCAAE